MTAKRETSNPLRIFLSYGHDANEELVCLIRADLEARGHDVWFDKTEIKAGDDWRRAILDGIDRRNQVLSFLSKHSTRDPGVGLDEIAIYERINEKEDTANFRLSSDSLLIFGRLSIDYSPCARTVNLPTIYCCGASDRKISRR